MQAPATPSEHPARPPEGRACPSCGAANGLTAAFCWRCYQPFGARAAPPGLAGSPRPDGATGPPRLPGHGSPRAPQWTPPPTPVATPGSGRSIGTLTAVVVAALAAIAGVVWFMGRADPVHLPESFGGLTRIEDAQTRLVVEAFRDEVDTAGLEGDMVMYGDGVPTAALIWVRDASVPSTESAFDQFATGFDAGIGSQGSLDGSAKTTETVEGVTYVCAPVVSVAPGTLCMWQDEDVFWLLFELSGDGLEDGQALAVVAHDAIEAA